jgi:hypothetical protein
MRYVIAGYVFVLGVLFLYAVQLIWRRRRLVRAVDRAAAGLGATEATGGTGVSAQRPGAGIGS